MRSPKSPRSQRSLRSSRSERSMEFQEDKEAWNPTRQRSPHTPTRTTCEEVGGLCVGSLVDKNWRGETNRGYFFRQRRELFVGNRSWYASVARMVSLFLRFIMREWGCRPGAARNRIGRVRLFGFFQDMENWLSIRLRKGAHLCGWAVAGRSDQIAARGNEPWRT